MWFNILKTGRVGVNNRTKDKINGIMSDGISRNRSEIIEALFETNWKDIPTKRSLKIWLGKVYENDDENYTWIGEK
jgi:hypothetical protein